MNRARKGGGLHRSRSMWYHAHVMCSRPITINGGAEFRPDCRHFQWDRPCRAHKASEQRCPGCPLFERREGRIVVVKLAAPGDVLRTTAILPPLRRRFPRHQILWVTEPAGAEILAGNPYLDSIITVPSAGWEALVGQHADLVLNADAEPVSAQLTRRLDAAEVRGFVGLAEGSVRPRGEWAERWMALGLRDDLKLANLTSYPEIVSRMFGLGGEHERPQMILTAAIIEKARRKLIDLGWRPDVRLVGINTGGGTRWRKKKWKLEGFAALAHEVESVPGLRPLLLGGPAEVEFNGELGRFLGRAPLDAGCTNGLREFAALVSHCDVLVTGDTLALHMGVARGTEVVALFGPTSAAEIDLYGSGEKVVSPARCVGCYQLDCDLRPDCMDLITVADVMEAVSRALAKRDVVAPQTLGAAEPPAAP